MTSKDIFIIHGRDAEVLNDVEAFVRSMGCNPIVLYKEPSRGDTIIEKFEKLGSESRFAIVLVTPDDKGGLATRGRTKYQRRARQNVIFEWGYFIAKLGRDHVCALVKGNVEFPSDYSGVVYVEYDGNGNWRTRLRREVESAKELTGSEELNSGVELTLQRILVNHRRRIKVSVMNNGDKNIIVKEIGVQIQCGKKFNYSMAKGDNEVPRSIRAGEVSNFLIDIDKMCGQQDNTALAYVELADGSMVMSGNFTQDDVDWHGSDHVNCRPIYMKRQRYEPC